MISVCVPTYNRPEMMEQLINSFLRQDHGDKELVISDDSNNRETEELVERIGSLIVKYYKNEQNLGYCKNLIASINRAKGSYVLVLGDDDILLTPTVLSEYVAAFEANPEVNYVYCNQIQFSNKLVVENYYTHFEKDTYFKKGEDAMKNIWTTSIFIPGIGLRKNVDMTQYYPKENVLFPQLELVGHIVNLQDAFGLKNYLIAGRAHEEQLGFYAIKGERIKGSEKHGTLELFEIFNKLAPIYNFPYTDDFLARNLIKRYVLAMLKEKSIVGSELMRINYEKFCAVSKVARESIRLKIFFLIAYLTPIFAIRIMRILFLRNIRRTRVDEFRALESKLRTMVSAP